MPITLYFNITYQCDCRCLFCAADINIRKDLESISLRRFREYMTKYNVNRWDSVIINGGEPFCHKDILTILHEINLSGANITIFTNGNWFSDPRNCDYLKYINSIELPVLTLNSDYDAYLTSHPDNLMHRLSGLKNIIKTATDHNTKTRVKLLLTKGMLHESPRFISSLIKQIGYPDYFSIVYPNQSLSVKSNNDITPSFESIRDPLLMMIDELLASDIPFDLVRVPVCLLDESHQLAYSVQISRNVYFSSRDNYIYIDPTHEIVDPGTEFFPAMDCYCERKDECDHKYICAGIPRDISLISEEKSPVSQHNR